MKITRIETLVYYARMRNWVLLPISALTALQSQAGLDGFLAIEKYLLKQRGLFRNTLRVERSGWELDTETCAEIDRLFALLQRALGRDR